MSHAPAKKVKRGRPRSEEKRQQIMSAAIELFTLNGFEGTSVDDIAAAAGVSKQTVYSHYGSKENLFGLAISTKCKESGIGYDDLDPEEPPERMLPEVARRFLKLITSREATRVHAVCTGSVETHPELGRIYFEQGPVQTAEAVAAYLAAQDLAGTLRIENPLHAAWQFLCMLKAEEQLRTQFNIGRMDPAENQAYVDSAVAMFLRAYRPGNPE
jgi:TetR/AcrR family transcriptional repressor of mexJK operon